MNAVYITLSIFFGLLSLALIAFAVVVLVFLPKKSYFSALFSHNHIPMKYLISARLRKLPYDDIVNTYIVARKAGIIISVDTIENLYVSGVDAEDVVNGLAMAKNSGLKYDFKTIQKIALSGRKVTTFITECLTSKSIETGFITAMCGDLQELSVKVRLTLMISKNNLASSLLEDTLLARTQEAIVSSISSTFDHKALMKKPLYITKSVFDAEVDNGCFYELASVDILELKLGKNYAADKEKEQIEKQHLMEKNRIESRRLTALAVEQEMKARTQEMKAKLIEKQMEVPESIVKSIEEGKFENAIDYYKLENLQADTAMRRKLAGQMDEDSDEEFDFEDDED